MSAIEKNQLELFDEVSFAEGPDVEFKSAKGGLPGSLWETYSAFANSQGGTIFLGIVQKGQSVKFQGVDEPDKIERDFWNLVNNKDKVSQNLLKEDDFRVVSSVNGYIIQIRVPRADRRQRPVYVGRDPFRGTFRRNHEGDYRCSENEIRRMFADQGDEGADSRILSDFAWDDLDPESITQFRNRFHSRDGSHPWLRDDDQRLLERLGAWRRDRRTGEVGVTVAGLLMFGRAEAITSSEGIPGFHLDYRERLSDNPMERWSDRLTMDGSWEANLFQFYQRVILKLAAGPGVRQPYRIDLEGYRRKSTPVHEALQEALVNALIHADHFGQGGIVIDRYFNGIEFSNPGTLLISREQILRGGISECRNKALQKMFQMLGVGDKAGSGIDKIRSSWAAEHWQSPRLWEATRPDRVYLRLPMVSILPEGIVERLRLRFGTAFQELGPDEVQALVAAEIEGEITNQRLQEMLSLHRVDITHMLRGLVRDGLLRVEGIGRGTRYFPATEADLGGDSSGGVLPGDAGHGLAMDGLQLRSFTSLASGSTPHLPPSTPHLAPSTPLLPPSTPLLPPLPSNDPRPSAAEGKPGGHRNSAWEALMDLAKPVREAGKVSAEVLQGTILALCKDRFLSLRELSELLDRGHENLRDRHIGNLVRRGRLELQYPGTPRHRGQAYRTAVGATEGDLP